MASAKPTVQRLLGEATMRNNEEWMQELDDMVIKLLRRKKVKYSTRDDKLTNATDIPNDTLDTLLETHAHLFASSRKRK